MSDKPDPIIIMIEPDFKPSLEAARLLSQLEKHDLPIIVAERPKRPVTGRLILMHAIASTLIIAPMIPRMLEDFAVSSETKKDRFYTPNHSDKFQSMASYKASKQSQHIYPIFQPHCARQARAVRKHKDTLRGRNLSPDN